MALSLGGGSFINALMGQAGNVGQQRQRQQDQLMQMMMQGFVPNEASQQGAQSKGLLSQLIGPTGALPLQSPKPMRPGDFEMAPWNPAEMSRVEREARKAEADARRQHEVDAQNRQFQQDKDMRVIDQDWDVSMANMEQIRTEANIEAEHQLRVALAEANDKDQMAQLKEKHRLQIELNNAKHAKAMLLEGEKSKNRGKLTPKDYVEMAESLRQIDEAIDNATSWWYPTTGAQEKKVNELKRIRNEIKDLIDAQSTGATKAVGELTDALGQRARTVTAPPTTRTPTTQHQAVERRN